MILKFLVIMYISVNIFAQTRLVNKDSTTCKMAVRDGIISIDDMIYNAKGIETINAKILLHYMDIPAGAKVQVFEGSRLRDIKGLVIVDRGTSCYVYPDTVRDEVVIALVRP